MLKDLLFPKLCLGCGKLGVYICIECQKKLSIVDKDICIYCHQASYLGLTHPRCQRTKGIDGFISIFHYNPTLKKIIKQIKYRLVKDAFQEFFSVISNMIFVKLSELYLLYPSLVIQPIPLHPFRFRQRGFNQAEEIGLFMQSLYPLKSGEYLRRTKNTFSQAQLQKRADRYANMRGAFKVEDKEDIKKLSIILVDDVVTSGASVKEAARVLKQAEVSKVFVFSIARG